MNDVTRWVLAMIASPLLAACSTARPDQTDDYAQGWRRARVEAIVAAQAPVRSAYRDCRPATGSVDTAGGPYVLASYSFGGSPNLRHTMVVRLPPDQQPVPGQPILINIERCKSTLPAASLPY
ncbi:MAG: hypothetical protein HYX44_15160 [Aquabacterium sp.]|nr:hypothetical protein [Aquabacterium sp.]